MTRVIMTYYLQSVNLNTSIITRIYTIPYTFPQIYRVILVDVTENWPFLLKE